MTGAPVPVRWRHPVLDRDYVRLASRPRSFLTRALLVAAAALVALPALLSVRRGGAEPGLALLSALCSMTTLAVGVMALNEASDAVPSERRQGTLALLRLAPLGERGLAAALLFSRALSTLLLVVGLLPVGALAFLLGGVSLADVAFGTLGVAAAAAQAAAVGLRAGYGATAAKEAGRRASFVAVGLLISPTLLGGAAFLLRELSLPTLAAVAGAVAEPLGGALVPLTSLAHGPTLGEAGLLVAGSGVLAALSILSTARCLRREEEPVVAGPAGGAGAPAPGRGAARESVDRFTTGAEARRLLSDAGDADGLLLRGRLGRIPLAWMEARPRGRPWARRLGAVATGTVFALLLGVPLGLAGLASVPVKGVAHWITAVLAVPFLATALAFLGTGSYLAEEREAGRLEVHRSAPFRGVDFLRARPVALLRRAGPLLVTCAVLTLLLAPFGLVRPLPVLGAVLGALCAGPAYAAAAAWLAWGASSLRSARMRIAIGCFLLLPCSGFVPLAAGGELGGLWTAGLVLLHPLTPLLGPGILLLDPGGMLRSGAGPAAAIGVALSLLLYGIPGWLALLRPGGWTDRLVERATS